MTDELQRNALARDIARRLPAIEIDALRVIDHVVTRLELGRERYGDLNLAAPRDWSRELAEEQIDAVIYAAARELAAQDMARESLREAARREMLGEFAPGQHATKIGGPDPYESVEVELGDLGGEGG